MNITNLQKSDIRREYLLYTRHNCNGEYVEEHKDLAVTFTPKGLVGIIDTDHYHDRARRNEPIEKLDLYPSPNEKIYIGK